MPFASANGELATDGEAAAGTASGAAIRKIAEPV
jgi:hypothetical protein